MADLHELSDEEAEILTLLIEISDPDPDELPPVAPADPSPELTSLLGWAEKESATEYAASFERGYRDGQAIAQALRAEEAGASIDEVIRMLEQAEAE